MSFLNNPEVLDDAVNDTVDWVASATGAITSTAKVITAVLDSTVASLRELTGIIPALGKPGLDGRLVKIARILS
jgi:hypothetical protein